MLPHRRLLRGSGVRPHPGVTHTACLRPGRGAGAAATGPQVSSGAHPGCHTPTRSPPRTLATAGTNSAAAARSDDAGRPARASAAPAPPQRAAPAPLRSTCAYVAPRRCAAALSVLRERRTGPAAALPGLLAASAAALCEQCLAPRAAPGRPASAAAGAGGEARLREAPCVFSTPDGAKEVMPQVSGLPPPPRPPLLRSLRRPAKRRRIEPRPPLPVSHSVPGAPCWKATTYNFYF